MAKNRHDFSSITVQILGKRVGLICSNPDCGKSTSGPHTDPEKATIVGIAAHIAAAAAGGPRYDGTLSEKERKSAANGIWLCANCATLIDKDPMSYSVALLQKWKSAAEGRTDNQLKGINAGTTPEEKLAHIDLDLVWTGTSRHSRGMSEKQREITGDNPIQAGSPVINHWLLRSFYSLVVYNNSGFHAYNLKITAHQRGLEFEQLPAKNNLHALGNIELDATFVRGFEGTFLEADDLLKPTFSADLLGAKYDVQYTDDTRKQHISTFQLTEEGFVKIDNV